MELIQVTKYKTISFYVIHSCEPLNINKYIRSVVYQCNCESWKEIYWRLWSECHFLKCITCKLKYSVRNSEMCQYHPENPEYFSTKQPNLEQPIGKINNIQTGLLLHNFAFSKHIYNYSLKPKLGSF